MLEFLTLQIEHASSPLLGKKRRTESRVLKTLHSSQTATINDKQASDRSLSGLSLVVYETMAQTRQAHDH
jgi:hypothetical protein